jgi:hypothetical protein
MAFEISTPIVYEDKKDVKPKNIFSIIKRDSVFLVLLLAIVGGILLLQNYNFIQDATSSIFSKLQATVSPQSSIFEGYERLDMPEVNLENLLPKSTGTTALEAGQGLKTEASAQEQETINPKKLLTLSEIEKEVFEIEQKIKILEQEVNKLSMLTEIQKEINSISWGVNNLDKEIYGSDNLTESLCLK